MAAHGRGNRDFEPRTVYLHRTENGKLLIPVLGMKTTQDNLAANNRIKVIVGSKV